MLYKFSVRHLPVLIPPPWFEHFSRQRRRQLFNVIIVLIKVIFVVIGVAVLLTNPAQADFSAELCELSWPRRSRMDVLGTEFGEEQKCGHEFSRNTPPTDFIFASDFVKHSFPAIQSRTSILS